MKIDNIKTGLKRTSAVALATLSMCPSMNAAGRREYEESNSVVSNVVSFVLGGGIVGGAWALIHFFGGEEVGKAAGTKFIVPEELEKLYEKYNKKAAENENENEKAVIDAIYNYLKYSFENAFVTLEKVDENISDAEFNKIFEKSAEYRYFGKLELVDQKKLKEHFKGNYGKKSHDSKGYIYQLGYADGFLVEAVKPNLSNELVVEFVEKLLNKYNNGHMIRDDISDWLDHWTKKDN